MHDVSSIIPCPDCGASLPPTGLCAYCGSQARGFWNDLDLGRPELADAVMQGLDYYLVLNVAAGADDASLSAAYRIARRLYPDDPRRLHPQLARQLGLLEEAWRILGVPERRALYDRLRTASNRSRPAKSAQIRSLDCVNCGSPVAADAQICAACGTERSVKVAEMPVQQIDNVIDYYAVLGVYPTLVAAPVITRNLRRGFGLFDTLLDVDEPHLSSIPRYVPPTPDEIRSAYLARQKELLFRNDPEAEIELEVAYRVLSDDHRRAAFDSLMRDLRERGWTAERMRALSALDREVRAEMGSGVAVDGAALLQQGKGYLKLNLVQQAVPILQQAAQALPQSAEAQYIYGMALWRSADLVSLTAHQLRQIKMAFEAAQRLDSRLHEILAPYLDVCTGMLHYNDSAVDRATDYFRAAAARYPQFAPAWRMCAAAALHKSELEIAADACRRANGLMPENEPILLLSIAIAWRRGRRDEAQAFATRVARLRGQETTAQAVLRELGFEA